MPRLAITDGVSEWGTYEDIMTIVQPADILEMKRFGYSHYAMFIRIEPGTGRGLCAHVNYLTNSANRNQSQRGFKGLHYLEEVIGGSRCRVNNMQKEARGLNLTERSIEEQIAAALDGFETDAEITEMPFNYHLAANNCEVNVTEWKYGDGFSTQVDRAAKVAQGSFWGFAGAAAVALGAWMALSTKKSKEEPREVGVLAGAGAGSSKSVAKK